VGLGVESLVLRGSWEFSCKRERFLVDWTWKNHYITLNQRMVTLYGVLATSNGVDTRQDGGG
jgi:hypothetical protein